MAPPRIPSLNWLRVFEAAARYQSFARAAEVLNMSPPAVSQQIRALEGALGRELFERGAHSVRLTQAGLAFLPTVAEALGEIEVSAASLFGNPGGETLNLQVSLMFGCSWLAARLPEFLEAHPGIQVSVMTAIHDEEFRRSGADMRITFGLPPGPGEDGDRLFGERLYAVARPEIAATIGAAADLTRHTLIEIATHRANWMRLLDHAGVAPERGLRMTWTDTTQLAFALAAAGGGVALARAPATDQLERDLGLVPCVAGLTMPGLQHYHLTYPATGRLSRAALAFRDWLLSRV
ncbi:LysR family transcriptional regulator [Limibaculum sp. M0105]|uniref:LysR family transcriptional regulator n=1 Tax=Thermohalobaculum xanthum TaxID=2753746 RepID=A0A8J7M6S6_9RHOB|nr:LysR family transcriptional regulator [Thermohalobaculum xanthum]MBK0399306.1 LysR family transcriptional regulator [Thermohalobaculum xanthum]